jgi:hypothetical protein
MVAEGTDQLSLCRQSETRSRNRGTHSSNDKLESELRRKGDSVTIWVAGTTSEEQGILGMTGLGVEGSEDFQVFIAKDVRTYYRGKTTRKYHV